MDETSRTQLLVRFLPLILLFVTGLLLVGYGLYLILVPDKPTVTIVAEDSSISEERRIVVDISGAVQNPGAYTLSAQSRVGDVLVLAGGLSSTADREWVSRTLNLAEIITDGKKIYIPHISEAEALSRNQDTNTSHADTSTINVNTASQIEIETLSGIGAARALSIINNRPYGSLDELVTKAKIPESVYEKIRTQVNTY